jgi:5-methylcytosine-specific restriction endonuclease McrA
MAEKQRRNMEARAQAQANGDLTYLTGIPCSNGHSAPRYTSSGRCLECHYQKKPPKPRKTREERLAYLAQWYQDHREEMLAYSKARYQANKDKWPTYQEQGPEKVKARVSAWQKANPDKVSARQKRARALHPEWAIADRARRSPRARGLGEKTYTRADLQALLASQGFVCAAPHCMADLRVEKKHLDHVVPVIRGGSCDLSNLQYLCVPCNLSKGTKLMSEWLSPDMQEAA